MDFTIVFDKNSGQYFGIDPTGALEGSITPMNFKKEISIEDLGRAFKNLVDLEA